MNEKYIEETLKNHRMNKTLLWNTLILTFGGEISVFFKALNTKNPIFESLFLSIGFLLICVLFYSISEISIKISRLSLQLKEGEK
ncbi:MAG TPA: hypothetical protein DDW90_11440 [Cyanobacteria bacterium UBA9971]|nr:hypothetical protein [Cyanobacteria bacterium UBA9971]